MDVNGLFLRKKALSEAELKEAAEELGMSLTEVKEMYQRAKGMQASGFKFAEKGLTKRQFDVLVIKAKERAKKVDHNNYVEEDAEDETQTRTKSMGAGSITGKRRNPIATQGYDLGKFDLLTGKAMALVNLPVEFWANATATWTEKEKKEVKDEIIRLTTETYDVATKEKLQFALKQLSGTVLKEEVSEISTGNRNLDLLLHSIPELKRFVIESNMFPQQVATKEENFKEYTLEAIAQRHNAYKPRTVNVGAIGQSTHLNPNMVQVKTKAQEEEDLRILAQLDAIAETFQGKTFKEQPDNRVKTGNPVYDQFTSQVLNPVNRFG